MRIIGQARVKRALSIAAKTKKDILFLGCPGLGKSTMGRLYASLFDGEILSAQGSEVEEYLDVIKAHSGPCIIDEVHDARGTAIISIIDDTDRTCLPLSLTTTEDACFGPMVSRCLTVVLEQYSNQELAEIASTVAPSMSDATRLALARLSRGSPRRIKLFAEMLQSMIASADCNIDVDIGDGEVNRLLTMIGFPAGLNLREVQLMRALESGPRSKFSLAGVMGCKPSSLWAIEAFTVANNLTAISSRGRILTMAGRTVLQKIESQKND